MKAISLGAGVQSTAMLLLSNEGVIERADVAIFADTGWEPKAVYEHLERLEKESSIPVIRVSAGNLRSNSLGSERFASMPLFTKEESGKIRMLKRQCTPEYKVEPINKKVRELGATMRDPAELWIGISIDEAHRMKSPWVKYMTHRWPLVEIGWTRSACDRYLREKGWSVVKSSCIGCPFHDDNFWERLRRESPDEFADAVDFDERVRDMKGVNDKVYLHRRAIPLRDAVLEPGQQGMLMGLECGGYCDT